MYNNVGTYFEFNLSQFINQVPTYNYVLFLKYKIINIDNYNER